MERLDNEASRVSNQHVKIGRYGRWVGTPYCLKYSYSYLIGYGIFVGH